MSRSGLHNFGWNCYINSALQCLASSDIINNIIKKYEDEDKEIQQILEKYNFGQIPFNNSSITSHAKQIIQSQPANIATDNTIKILSKIADKGIKIFIYFEFCDIIKRLRKLKQMNIDHSGLYVYLKLRAVLNLNIYLQDNKMTHMNF